VTDPLTIGVPIAKGAIGPLAGVLGRTISGDEEKMVRRSFRQAMREVREERAARSDGLEKPRLRDKALNAGKKAGRATKRVATPTGQRQLASDRAVARWLAQTWATVSSEEAASRDKGGDGDRTKPPPDWFAALVEFLEKVALEGAGVAAGSDGSDGADPEAREKARAIWVDVLGSKELTAEDVGDWALQVATKVEISWRENERLHGLISQLNHDSRQGLIEAIAFSAKDVAKSLRRLVAVTVPATLAGGAGIVLLVLFVDKG
jgi:hypothetical protein